MYQAKDAPMLLRKSLRFDSSRLTISHIDALAMAIYKNELPIYILINAYDVSKFENVI